MFELPSKQAKKLTHETLSKVCYLHFVIRSVSQTDLRISQIKSPTLYYEKFTRILNYFHNRIVYSEAKDKKLKHLAEYSKRSVN